MSIELTQKIKKLEEQVAVLMEKVARLEAKTTLQEMEKAPRKNTLHIPGRAA